MRKTTMAMALGLALSFGAVGAASAQSAQQPTRGHAERGGRRGPGLLKGITLTPDQKTKLQALRKDEKSDASREQFRKAMADVRAARQRGDTAAAKAQMQTMRTQMEQSREREFASMRSILTPDQQKQFDANVADWKQHMAQRGEHRGGKQGHAGQRVGAPNGR
jgi:protein CpxP